MTSLRNWLAGCLRARLGGAPDAQRWIVLDVETTGLDPQSDSLLCVAALAIHFGSEGPSLRAQDSFEVVLRQEVMAASHDNVLLHGIGWGQQRQGMPAAQALQRLQDWVGSSPVLAYHAGFDRAVLRRAYQIERMRQPRWPWLDLADALPAAFPALEARSLDAWMRALGVQCARRHQAAADVWATAQLLLKAWPHWQRQGLRSWSDLTGQAEQVRWLRVSASAAQL
jgi:DNA polymerase III subunit epsilon